MELRKIIVCEQCGADASVAMTSYEDAKGERIEWPKAEVRPDCIYFSIEFPNCGPREQCVLRSSG